MWRNSKKKKKGRQKGNLAPLSLDSMCVGGSSHLPSVLSGHSLECLLCFLASVWHCGFRPVQAAPTLSTTHMKIAKKKEDSACVGDKSAACTRQPN